MIFKRIHFPILFLVFLLFSCKKIDGNFDSKKDEFTLNDEKGNTKRENQEYDSAFYYYNKSREFCDKDQADRMVYILGKIAKIQIIASDFYGAEATCTEAIPYFDNCKDQVYIAEINTILGIVKEELHDYDNAIKFYNKGIYKTIETLDFATIKNNISVVYIDKKEYTKAIKLLQSLLEKKEVKNEKNLYAKIMDNIGFAYFKIKNPKSIDYLNQSLKIRDSINDDAEKTASYIHLSNYYKDSNNKLSLIYAKKALRSASKTKSGDDKLEALDLIIKNTNDPIIFKNYYDYYNLLNDSINKARQIDKNQFANIKYNTGKALQEAKLQKTQKYLYILLLILISAVGVYAFSAIRKKNEEKLKTISYETETHIAKKIHDELANDVFNALTFAESQNLSDPNKKEALLDNLDTIYNRTRNISRENSEIKTDSQFARQLTDLLLQYQNEKVNVIIQDFSTINWDEIKKETKIAIYRVLQELMVNMKKHSECTFVILKFGNQKSHIEINYSDNGKGAKMLNSKKGLQNAENRILAIKGTLTFDSETDKGFKASIIIPK